MRTPFFFIHLLGTVRVTVTSVDVRKDVLLGYHEYSGLGINPSTDLNT